MADLSGLVIKDNRKGMLNLGSVANTPLSTTLQAITDGLGNNSPIQLATDKIAIKSNTEYDWVSAPSGTTSKTSFFFDSSGRMAWRNGTGFLRTFDATGITANRSYVLPDANTTLAGLAVPNNIFTGKITMGTSTGTGLLNFPDAGTTSTDGISFGSSVTNLYRKSPSIIQTYGTLSVLGSIINQSTGKLALGDLNNITISPTSLTGSLATSAINLTQTWNTTGNPTAIFANITNTASGSTSKLMDLQVGGTSQFSVSKTGVIASNPSGLTLNMNGGGIITAGSGGTFAIQEKYGMRIYNIDNASTTGVIIGANANAVASAVLELNSTNKGFLPTRMTTTQRTAISSPAEGLEVYDLTLHKKMIFDGTIWQSAW